MINAQEHYFLHRSAVASGMTEEVVVTRKGQTTIPARLRSKYKIRRGTKLEVVDTKKGILLKPKASLYDAAGSASSEASVAQMKKLLDKLRNEDA
ncbi:MAG: AbrB/MazE/SpoVT family DNA-binding domain-containing protein [Thaumarchaeota archaeon]|nr:AbrB/MazE/SpoVT family DNA-binding domain-containing protein [Nitrososphaerota archaeon]